MPPLHSPRLPIIYAHTYMLYNIYTPLLLAESRALAERVWCVGSVGVYFVSRYSRARSLVVTAQNRSCSIDHSLARKYADNLLCR